VTRYKRAVELMQAELGDELVALDAGAGQCFGFNSVATSVWRQLEEPRSLEQLKDALLQEYDVDPDQCERELHELLGDLSGRGLVVAIA